MGQLDMRADSKESTPDGGIGQTMWRDPTTATAGRVEADGADVAQILKAWRAVERQVADMAEGTPEWSRAQEEIARLRDDYHRQVDGHRSDI